LTLISETLHRVVYLLTSPTFYATPGHFVCYHVYWASIMMALIGQMLYYPRSHVLPRRVAILFPHHPPRSPSPFGLMSHSHPTFASSSNFQMIFDDALKAYERRTKKQLRTHPLAAQLQNCNSPSSILDVLQQQVQKLNQSQRRNERWTRWLDPTVKVLHVFSETLGEVVTLVCPSSCTCLRSALTYLCDRHSHRERPSLLHSASSY